MQVRISGKTVVTNFGHLLTCFDLFAWHDLDGIHMGIQDPDLIGPFEDNGAGLARLHDARSVGVLIDVDGFDGAITRR